MKIESKLYTLPTYWASALVNDDRSSLSDEDEQELDEWLEFHKPGRCVEVSEESDFRRFQGMGCNVSDFTFHTVNYK